VSYKYNKDIVPYKNDNDKVPYWCNFFGVNFFGTARFLLLVVTEVMETMKDQHVKVTEAMETCKEVEALNWMLLLGTIPWFYLALASSSCKQQSHKIGHMRIKNLMH
jgi:hypothetical protein